MQSFKARCRLFPAIKASMQPNLQLQRQPSLNVCTFTGQRLQVPFTPGTTTAAEIRHLVAGGTNQAVAKVRLAYAGHELLPSEDDQPFLLKGDNTVLHTVPLDHHFPRNSSAGTNDHLQGSAVSAPKSTDSKVNLPASKTQPHVLTVYSMYGMAHKVTVINGATTAGDVRAEVSKLTNTYIDQVRLSYAGQELDPAKDDKPFQVKPDVNILHSMQRMTGGTQSQLKAVHWTPAKCNRSLISCYSRNSYNTTTTISCSNTARPLAWQGNCSNCHRHIHSLMQQHRLRVFSKVAAGRRWGTSVSAPDARPGVASAQVQLAKQLRDLNRHPIPGISAAPDEDDMLKWNVKVGVMI
eukprot:gene1154-1494_t